MRKITITCLAASILSVPAFAQTFGRIESEVVPVSERARPDYDALGINAGSFVVKPQIETSYKYDDNVYKTENAERDDNILVIRPEVAVESNWNRHELKLNASGDLNYYSDYDNEDLHNFAIGAEGRIDVMAETYIYGGAKFSELTEPRSSADSLSTIAEPNEFSRTDLQLGFARTLGLVGVDAGVEYRGLDFDDNRTGLGVAVDNDYRDRDEFDYTLRGTYDIGGGYGVFAQGAYHVRSYDNKDVENRDNDGYSLRTGLSADLTGKLNAEAYIGYFDRSYDDSVAFDDIDGVDYGGQVTWNATDLTSLIASYERNVEETGSTAYSGYVSSGGKLRLEHELLTSLLLGAEGSFANNDYEGRNVSPEREDDLMGFGLDAKYMINNNFDIKAAYDYLDRDSNITGQDFDNNIFKIGLTSKL